jgi:hypothetical protein
MVGLGTGGKVSIYNPAGSVDVIADVNGWFTDSTSTTGGTAFVGINPRRAFDSRAGSGKVCAGCAINFVVTATTIKETALVLNATVTGGSAASFLTLYPDDGTHGAAPPPLASDVNFVAGQTVPNLSVVALGTNSEFNVYNAAGSVDVILDEYGFYGPVVAAPPQYPSIASPQTFEAAIQGSPQLPNFYSRKSPD